MEISLHSAIEQQLHILALQSGQSEAVHVERALISYLEDMEDANRAKMILSQPIGRALTQDEMERELGFDFSQTADSSK